MRRFIILAPSFLFLACVGDSPAVVPLADGGTDGPTDGNVVADAGVDSVGPAPVSGVVVDERDVPVANADVRIGATDAKTDSAGKFSIVAPATYDVLIVNSTQGTTIDTTTNKKLTAFLGLSSRTPRLQVQGAAKRLTTVTVNTSGVTTPLPSGDQWYVLTAPTTLSSSSQIGLSPNNVQTMSQINWTGAEPAQGSFYGYVVTTVGSFPTAWKTQTAATPFTMSGANATFTANFNGGSPAVGDLNVTIVPGSSAMAGYFVGHDPAPGARRLFGQLSGFTQTSQSSKLPTAGSAFASARATTPNNVAAIAWRAGLKVPSNVTITIPTGDLSLSAPAANATGIGTGSSFSWTAPAGHVFYTRINCGAAPSSDLADIVGATPSFVLPDTGPLGVPLPTATSCTWSVTAFGPVANADGLVGPSGWLNASNFTRATIDGTAFITLARTFTSK